MNLIWHYTPLILGAHIIKDGFIRPSVSNVIKGIDGLVWFSANQVMEKTAARMVSDGASKEFSAALAKHLRFGIPKEMATLFSKADVSFTARRKVLRDTHGANPAEWYVVGGEVDVGSCVVQSNILNKWADVGIANMLGLVGLAQAVPVPDHLTSIRDFKRHGFSANTATNWLSA